MLLTTELIHALPPHARRGFSCDEAASYVGVSPGHFRKLVESGVMPPALPLLNVRRWDKSALDAALDRMSGLPTAGENAQPNPYEVWRKQRGQG